MGALPHGPGAIAIVFHGVMDSKQLAVIGWREWISLPELGIPGIKVKVDTGARSSAIHAVDIKQFELDGVKKVRFQIAPIQSNDQRLIMVETNLLEERAITDSGGHQQVRPVILTAICLGTLQWPIELTLTNRDEMGFRMLLGRQAVRDRFLVNPGQSYLQSQKIAKEQGMDLSEGDDQSC